MGLLQTIIIPMIFVAAVSGYSFVGMDLSRVEALAGKISLFEIPNKLIYLPLCYVILELSHYIAHFSSHRVRFLWCFHSLHYTPSEMMLIVDKLHFPGFPYIFVVRFFISLSLGVSYEALATVWLLDGIWGWLIHVREKLVPSKAFKRINKLIMTPSHHRVHHAINPEYINKNYCNLISVWDRVFGSYQEEDYARPTVYGLRQSLHGHGFVKVLFFEFFMLARDMKNQKSLKDKFLLVIMPPEWVLSKK